MQTAKLPTLGVGLGYRAPLRAQIFLNRPEVDFLEIIADHYFEPSAQTLDELRALRAHFPLVPHGLNLSLGSAEGLNETYLQRFAELVERVEPPWWSDHLACTHSGGIEIGHLSPLPFTREAVDVVVRNIRTARQAIAVPLILENITYSVRFPGSEMSESQFLCDVLEQSDCGLLLDVTNLYTNSVNLKFDPLEFLDQLPMERVVQLHFAGGAWQGTHLIDSHSHPVMTEVFHLLDEVLQRAPVKACLLERDEQLPEFGELVQDLQRARDLGRGWGRWA